MKTVEMETLELDDLEIQTFATTTTAYGEEVTTGPGDHCGSAAGACSCGDWVCAVTPSYCGSC